MIIALLGNAGSGKDAAAERIALALPEGYTAKIALADPLKRFCKEVFDFSDEQLYGPSELRNAPDPRFRRADGQQLSARYALQSLGTDWGRDCYPDVWVDAAVRRAHDMETSGIRVVVIVDCRFLNEARRIRALGGEVWRVTRPGCDGAAALAAGIAAHASEMEQRSPEMDRYVTREIVNDGTLDDLARRVGIAVLDALRRAEVK